VINAINQDDLVDIYRIFYPTPAGCTLFSLRARRIFIKIDNSLDHKTNLTKLKGDSKMFSGHYEI
jgi:hypothetical protein